LDYIHSDFCGPSRTFNFLGEDIARSSDFQFRSKSLKIRLYCVGHTKDSIYPNFHIKLDKRIDNLIILLLSDTGKRSNWTDSASNTMSGCHEQCGMESKIQFTCVCWG
jgi:hypothetical protein